MFKQSSQRVGTGTLNRVVREAVDAHQPPARDGRNPRIYYATQVGSAPPTIVLFVNSPSLFDAPYQRYLINTFRTRLPFKDVPIKLYLRARTQADPNAPKAEMDPDLLDPEALDESPVARVGSRSRLDRDINDLLAELED